ncbi:hypothetical protein FJM67_17095 [Maribrevibacterium harenarium]|uniref:Uncharacterized protein n=1 Tax=Maribrevibacterium harenarium TaxID=2589817 RepID=A0A501W2I0_9GAMM|nr:hypothetical protein [Maribrevibacterium harenarium]TPE44133.1 hypothetical protein FJM67_17095 [Maribrevibacterium harenarium]
MNTPMTLNPNFKESQLIEVAQLLADVRAGVVELHNKDLGDTNKSLGIRSYECSCTHLIKKSKEVDWLKILTPKGRFTFSVAGVPVRFWKGQPDKLPSGKLIRSHEAMMQMELLSTQFSPSEIIWFFVLSTDHTKCVDRAFFVGYSEVGEIIVNWEVPMSSKVTLITDIDENITHGVELESAVSKIKIKKKSKNAVNHE